MRVPLRMAIIWEFQSTLPARGATAKRRELATLAKISIHAPRTGSDTGAAGCESRRRKISIHAPRTGSDQKKDEKTVDAKISIHAPRTGSDLQWTRTRTFHRDDFNPRSPHGERRDRWQMYHNCQAFQSTLPARGATARSRLQKTNRLYISIHAPRTGSDEAQKYSEILPKRFQSTLPARGATAIFAAHETAFTFQSTLPARGATQDCSR